MLATKKFVANWETLQGHHRFEEMMAKVLSPELEQVLQTLWNRFVEQPTGIAEWSSKPLKLEDNIKIFEFDQLRTDGDLVQGEVNIEIPMLKNLHIEFFYATDHEISHVLTYVVNGIRTTSFEKVLDWLLSDEYARNRGFYRNDSN